MIHEIDPFGCEWVVQKKSTLYPLRNFTEARIEMTKNGKWLVITDFPIFQLKNLKESTSWYDMMDNVHKDVDKNGPYMSLLALQDYVRRNYPSIARDLTLFGKEVERCSIF